MRPNTQTKVNILIQKKVKTLITGLTPLTKVKILMMRTKRQTKAKILITRPKTQTMVNILITRPKKGTLTTAVLMHTILVTWPSLGKIMKPAKKRNPNVMRMRKFKGAAGRPVGCVEKPSLMKQLMGMVMKMSIRMSKKGG
jgi:hypothetical protein